MRLTVSRANLMCLALGATLVAAGCGQPSGGYTPAPETARAGLEAALAAWREGQAPGAIAGSPPVQVVDTSRQPGQTLEAFEVISETSLRGEGRCYVVGLTLGSPVVQERARYVVVGIDPIWVFRKEDYDKLAHWEHPMEEAEADVANEKSAAPETPTTATSSDTSHERS